MKKQIILICLLLSCCTTISFAQRDMKAFEHLAVGLEAGTTGIGLDVAVPLHPHFALRAGIAMFPYSYSTGFDIDFASSEMDNIINQYPNIKNELKQNGLPTNSSELDTEANLKAKLGLLNGKILVDIYPFRKASFHFVAGLYIGKSKLVSVTGKMPQQVTEVSEILNKYSQQTGVDFETGIALGDYSIQANELGNVDAAIKINSIKPYVGLGFGRSVPRKRIGYQFEMGVMFHGKPKIVSSIASVNDLLNDELSSSGITDIMDKITIYPMISLKLVGRIF